MTPILCATEYSCSDAVKILLGHDADPNKILSNNGITPIYMAARLGHGTIAKTLLTHRADPNKAVTDECGLTPVYIAVENGNEEVVNMLLAHNADPNIATTDDGTTPLYVAVANRRTAVVKMLLEHNADPNKARTNGGGLFPVYITAEMGYVEGLQALLGFNADPNRARYDNGCTPVSIAAQYGQAQAVEILLQHNANPSTATSDTGVTPLIFAAEQGNVGIVKALLAHNADPDLHQGTPMSALYTAAKNGHRDLVGVLLKHNADPNGGHGNVPIVGALKGNHTKIVKALLEYEADPNITTDPVSRNPLLIAAVSNCHLEIVKALLESQADPNYTINHGFIKTVPLTIAIEKNYTEIASVLLANNANPNVCTYRNFPGISRLERFMRTPLLLALMNGYADTAALLLESRADPNKTASNGETQLHIAVESRHTACVAFLLENEADPNETDPFSNEMPLIAAVRTRRSSHSIINALLAQNADPAAVVGSVQRNLLLEFSKDHYNFEILSKLNYENPQLLWVHESTKQQAESILTLSASLNDDNTGVFLVRYSSSSSELTFHAHVCGQRIHLQVEAPVMAGDTFTIKKCDSDSGFDAEGSFSYPTSQKLESAIDDLRRKLERKYSTRIFPLLFSCNQPLLHNHHNVLSVASSKVLHSILTDILPTAVEGNMCQYLQQILIAGQTHAVVRGVAPSTSVLFALRNDLIDGTLERKFNEALSCIFGAATLAERQWRFNKAAFAEIYTHILSQMDQLTPHQHDALLQCNGSKQSHISGPAGCGKTYIALHMVLQHLERLQSCSGLLEPVLFVAKNEGLAVFFVNWIVQRMLKNKKKHGTFQQIVKFISKSVYVIHSSPFTDTVYAPDFIANGRLIFVPQTHDRTYSFVVVDEAHHIFDFAAHEGDRHRVTRLCSAAANSLLLSDISQSNAAMEGAFPDGYTPVVLKEIVRNSSRIVTASMPFSRAAELADVTSQHGIRGPPLAPFMFDPCEGDVQRMFSKYAEGIVSCLECIFNDFPGVSLHNHLAILTPNQDFCSALQQVLEIEASNQFPAVNFDFVTSVDGAFASSRDEACTATWVVLDTLESFDGMERMFVIAVGLDSVVSKSGCSAIYRAITRAHMFVGVVQERIEGGWLEFTANVKLQDSGDFDEKAEAARVQRINLDIDQSSVEGSDKNDVSAPASTAVHEQEDRREPRSAADTRDVVKVLFDFDAMNEDQLGLRQGQFVRVIKREDEAWWEGELDHDPSKKGVFPSNFVGDASSAEVASCNGGAAATRATRATPVTQNVWQSNQLSLSKPVENLIFNPLQTKTQIQIQMTNTDYARSAVCNCDFFAEEGEEISIQLDEQLYVITDFGDGWTRVARFTGEQGDVPSSHIEIIQDRTLAISQRELRSLQEVFAKLMKENEDLFPDSPSSVFNEPPISSDIDSVKAVNDEIARIKGLISQLRTENNGLF